MVHFTTEIVRPLYCKVKASVLIGQVTNNLLGIYRTDARARLIGSSVYARGRSVVFSLCSLTRSLHRLLNKHEYVFIGRVTRTTTRARTILRIDPLAQPFAP